MRKTRAGKYKKELNKLSFGLLDTFIDTSLFCLYVIAQCGRNELFETIFKAIHLTKTTHINSLKRSIYKAKTKGYLEKKEDYYKITELGRKRLSSILPTYTAKRIWDAKLYLITYDIPEEKKKERDYLRDWLKKLGCALLQKSVWLTPYNPKRLIADFVKQHRLVGLILVSELSEGSGIGGKNILQVVARVYKLNEINKEYQRFLDLFHRGELKGNKLILHYLSILKKDPQLPFELLFEDWLGDEAHRVYFNELKKLSLTRRDRV